MHERTYVFIGCNGIYKQIKEDKMLNESIAEN